MRCGPSGCPHRQSVRAVPYRGRKLRISDDNGWAELVRFVCDSITPIDDHDVPSDDYPSRSRATILATAGYQSAGSSVNASRVGPAIMRATSSRICRRLSAITQASMIEPTSVDSPIRRCEAASSSAMRLASPPERDLLDLHVEIVPRVCKRFPYYGRCRAYHICYNRIVRRPGGEPGAPRQRGPM